MNTSMTKTAAVGMFGDVASLASALGITRQAIYQWPEELPQDQVDRINGAAMRLGIIASEKSSTGGAIDES